jgi:hypothetical protein
MCIKHGVQISLTKKQHPKAQTHHGGSQKEIVMGSTQKGEKEKSNFAILKKNRQIFNSKLGSKFFYHNFKLGSSSVWMASFFFPLFFWAQMKEFIAKRRKQ